MRGTGAFSFDGVLSAAEVLSFSLISAALPARISDASRGFTFTARSTLMPHLRISAFRSSPRKRKMKNGSMSIRSAIT